MRDDKPVLSICMTCRDGRETLNELRGGARLAKNVIKQLEQSTSTEVSLRGIQCMSQCKRPCIASLSSCDRFTYVFGDLDPENTDHIDALLALVALYEKAPEGFIERRNRPEALRSNILGRIPPLSSTSELVTQLSAVPAE